MRCRWMLAVVILAAAWMVTDAIAASSYQAADAAARARGSRQRLIATLGVLRRKQTRVDTNPELIHRLRSLLPGLQDPGPERLDEGLVRLVGRASWGARIVLAGFITTNASSRVPEMLGAMVGGEIGARDPAAAIRRLGEVAHFQIERRSARVVIVVPDGVVRLAYRVPRMRAISVRVHDNVAAFVIRPLPAAPGLIVNESSMLWYGPRGALVRRVPSLLSLKHRR